MGYGGSRQEAGRAVGQSGDSVIDGVINEDRLSLMPFTYKPNAGKVRLAKVRSETLKAHWMLKARKKAFLSPPAISPAAIAAAKLIAHTNCFD